MLSYAVTTRLYKAKHQQFVAYRFLSLSRLEKSDNTAMVNIHLGHVKLYREI